MKLKLFVLVLVLQSAWLLGTVATQEYGLHGGAVVLLQTERIDPRDLLRGDYLILNYKISTVPLKLFSPSETNGLSPGTKIYVAVAPGTNGFYQLTRASTRRFSPPAGEVLLAGTIDGNWWNGAGSVRASYGLERFYVAENTGNPVGALTVEAAVPSSGHPQIRQVYLDGKPYAEAMAEKSP